MRFDLENAQVGQVCRNPYVELGSVTGFKGKTLVTRTRSEPPYLSKWGKPKVRDVKGCLDSYHDELLGCGSNAVTNYGVGKLFPVMQDPHEYCHPEYQKSIIDHDGSYQGHGGPQDEHIHAEKARPKSMHSKDAKPRHRRSSSITERELRRRISSQEHSLIGRFLTSKSSKVEKSSILQCGSFSNAIFDSKVNEQEAITSQPVSLDAKLKDHSERTHCSQKGTQNKDTCFRCLNRLKDTINCCTCIVCFDAFCYHCFKDDVGYSSWFHEMITCSGVPSTNCKRWTLFGLGTIIFPCILLYPAFGGAVNQCIKCRLQQSQFKD